MSVVINGTSGISGVDGSAGTPAVQGTDTNTGMFFPTTDTIAFAEGGVEAMRIDSSGNWLLGKTSAGAAGGVELIPNVSSLGFGRLYLNSGYGAAANSVVFAYNGSNVGIIQQGTTATSYYTSGSAGTGILGIDANTLGFSAGGSERMRIDSSGNVGIGTSSPDAKLEVTVGDNGGINIEQSGASQTGYLTFRDSDGGLDGSVSYDHSTNAMRFKTATTERMRITSNGGVSFGSSGTAYGSSGQVLVSNGDTTPTWGSAIVSGTAQATTSGTTKDFTSIPSWVKRITVMFNSVSVSGTSSLLIQIGSGSVTTTGYTSNGNDLNMTSGTGGLSSTAGMVVSMNNAARSFSGHMMLTNISGNIWVSSHYGAGVGTSFSNVGGGNVTLSGVLDRVRITTVNGTDTFDAGSVNILYE